MTWSDANTECQRRPGRRLPLANQDFAAGDGSNLAVVNRLYDSPIGTAMKQTVHCFMSMLILVGMV
jgi:hypothetical protein